jgi:hypothetical protein
MRQSADVVGDASAVDGVQLLHMDAQDFLEYEVYRMYGVEVITFSLAFHGCFCVLF